MSNISTLSPAATYANLLLAGSNGQGISTVPQIIQDGLGNSTLMSLATTSINFDRNVGAFQLDGIALTASATTLNSLSNVAVAEYVLIIPNAQLPNASVLGAANGLTLISGANSVTVQPTAGSELAGIQSLNSLGIMVRGGVGNYSTVTLNTDATILLTNGSGVAGNPTLSVISDTNVQRVNSQSNGVFQSSKSQLNFIPGANTGISIIDNAGQNRTDITITASAINTFFFKAPCQAATTGALNAVYNNGDSGVGATLTNNGALAALVVDGYAANVGDRILVKNQAAQSQNGIYSVTNAGSGAVAWVLTRALDFNSPATIQPGDFTTIVNGTVNANTTWIQENLVITVGTDPIVWASFGFSGTVTSVNGTAGQIDVANPTTTPVISIDAGYVGQASITTLGTITTGVWNGTVITVPFGGTGLATLTTAYGVVCAGTTATGALQNAGSGTVGFVLTSNGAASLPEWQNPGSATFQIFVFQVDHGFVVGNIIKCTGSNTYALAQADNVADAEVIGIVVATAFSNTFTYQFGGQITALAGLTSATVYFLDPAVAGGYTATAPDVAGQVSKPLFLAYTATTAVWLNQRGQVL